MSSGLKSIFENQPKETGYLIWDRGNFSISVKKPSYEENREVLARLYQACTKELQARGIPFKQASRYVRSLWIEEADPKRPSSIPRVIGDDGFLKMYALGQPCPTALFLRLWSRLGESFEEKTIQLEPIYIDWNEPDMQFFDVDATPQGLLSKLFPSYRVKKDKILLEQIESDLKKVSSFEDRQKREMASLAILSHAAAYRELNGLRLIISSFLEPNKLVTYTCTQHLIAEGLKTVSLVPSDSKEYSIYLCQGTEFWPSQPSMLASIMANFGEHGSATEAYAHSWRRIHKQLRDLPGRPLVAGHSMGGALAIQIGLYSHELVERVYAYNPPVPNERDYTFYHQLPDETKEKIRISANLDDFAFWRIGSRVIGNVTLFLGKTRWQYYSINLWDCILLLPAFGKFIRNVHHAFPAHQSIAILYEGWVSVKLTQEEIEKENLERTTRFDYLHFLPKLYDPMKVLLRLTRRIFKWSLEEEYLKNEIEIVALHERDLIDTISNGNRIEIERQLSVLKEQKRLLLDRLNSRRKT